MRPNILSNFMPAIESVSISVSVSFPYVIEFDCRAFSLTFPGLAITTTAAPTRRMALSSFIVSSEDLLMSRNKVRLIYIPSPAQTTPGTPIIIPESSVKVGQTAADTQSTNLLDLKNQKNCCENFWMLRVKIPLMNMNRIKTLCNNKRLPYLKENQTFKNKKNIKF